MIFLSEFLRPYVLFLLGAAYTLQQTLEGMGVLSSNFVERDAAGHIVGSFWSPVEATVPILGALIIFSFGLMLLVLAAGYSLGRYRGLAIALLTMLTPGLLAILGIWPEIHWTPEVYEIGRTGALGSPWGMVPIVLMGLLTGWVAAIIFMDLFDLKDRFWHGFDHMWYAMAILTGLFFVWDSQTRNYEQSLRDTSQDARQASAYLLQQVRWFSNGPCRNAANISPHACLWSNDVQHKLIDYSTMNYEVYADFGPKSSDALYALYANHPNVDESALIRKELQSFNETQCPVKVISSQMSQGAQPSNICQATPSSLCSGIEKDHINDAIFPVAISNECVVPTLTRLNNVAKVEQSRVEKAVLYKHWRHIFYMIFSVLAGTKIASATAKFSQATTKIRGTGKERSLALLTRTAFRLARNFFVALFETLVALTQRLTRALKRRASRLLAAMKTPQDDQPDL